VENEKGERVLPLLWLLLFPPLGGGYKKRKGGIKGRE
jgi:hypothetical protein